MHNFTDLTKQKWKQRNYIIKKKTKKISPLNLYSAYTQTHSSLQKAHLQQPHLIKIQTFYKISTQFSFRN